MAPVALTVLVARMATVAMGIEEVVAIEAVCWGQVRLVAVAAQAGGQYWIVNWRCYCGCWWWWWFCGTARKLCSVPT